MDLGYCIKTLQDPCPMAGSYIVLSQSAFSNPQCDQVLLVPCARNTGRRDEQQDSVQRDADPQHVREMAGRRGCAVAPGWLHHVVSATSAPPSASTEAGGSAPQSTSSGAGYAVLGSDISTHPLLRSGGVGVAPGGSHSP